MESFTLVIPAVMSSRLMRERNKPLTDSNHSTPACMSSLRPLNRRRFLYNTALTGVVLSRSPFVRAADPVRKFRTVLIGCGWWGKNILREAVASGQVKIIGLCDVDSNA